MTKMSKTQKSLILTSHEMRTRHQLLGMIIGRSNTMAVMRRNKWVTGAFDVPTMAGLLAAGIDIYSEALEEHYQRTTCVPQKVHPYEAAQRPRIARIHQGIESAEGTLGGPEMFAAVLAELVAQDYAAAISEYAADRLARAEIVESEAHAAVVGAAVDGGGSNVKIAQAYADHDRSAEALRHAGKA
jgi:hypothetical protein